MAKPKKTEAQRLEEDTPAYLRFQESASTSASAFDDKPSPGNDGQDDSPPPSPTPSTLTQLPDPQPTPSPSGFLSSVSGPSKPKPISKSLAKALGLDDDSWQKFLLTAELLRQSAGSSDDGKFSVANLDKFNGTKPEKLETFEAQCRSVYLSNETLGAKGGVLGWYTANTLQGYGQSTHHILTWALEVNSEFSKLISLQFPWFRKYPVHSQCPQ